MSLDTRIVRQPAWKLWCNKIALCASDLFAFGLAKALVAMAGWQEAFLTSWAHSTAAGVVLTRWPVYALGLFWIWFVYRDYTYRKPLIEQYRYIIKLFFVMAIIDLATLALLRADFSRAEWLCTWLGAVVLLPLMRNGTRIVLCKFNVWQWASIIIGCGGNAREAYFALSQDRDMGYDVKAFFSPDNRCSRSPIESVPLIQSRKEEYIPYCRDVQFFIALEYEQSELRNNFVRYLSHIGCRNVVVIPALRGVPLIGTDVMHVFSHEVLMMRLHNNLARLSSRVLKRVFDVLIASLALLMFAPLMAILAFKISRDGGSAIFGHWRVGQSGKMFKCLKFRTMVLNSQEVLDKLLGSCPNAKAEWDKDFKLRNDPRVTSIGGFLRRTSLDELPQLWNVIRGDMSLVGPRPVIEEELLRYGDDKDYYLMAKPGVTGLWQVSGRNDTDYATRVYLDSWYVKNWSVWYDLVIMFKTLGVVIKREGAY